MKDVVGVLQVDDVPLNDWYTNDKLKEYGLIVLVEFGLVVCKNCEQGIVSSQLKGHFESNHPQVALTDEKITSAFKNCPVKLANGRKDERIMTAFEDLTVTHEPIRFLSIIDGFECLRCGYSCPSDSTIRSHYSKMHSDGGELPSVKDRWKEAKLQCLFLKSVTNISFFKVKGIIFLTNVLNIF